MSPSVTDGHPSERPTRELSEPPAAAEAAALPYSVLLRPELAAFHSPADRGIVTVALVLASRRTGVTRWPALWSSDFPRTRPFDRCARGRPAASRDAHSTGLEQAFGHGPSIATLLRRSASLFSARGTCPTVYPSNPRSSSMAAAWI